MACKNILVIPVETSFETRISWQKDGEQYPLVSANTLHGQWLHRWEQTKHGVGALAEQIRDTLKMRGVKVSVDERGKISVPFGTVAEIDADNARYFLLAIARFDDENKAHSDEQKIQEAVESLLVYYDKYGQGDSMYIPLLGTGRSRTGLDYQQSFDMIRSTLIANRARIQGEITVIATPEADAQIAVEGVE